jgi:2-methylcitrate dehydratase PrpD
MSSFPTPNEGDVVSARESPVGATALLAQFASSPLTVPAEVRAKGRERIVSVWLSSLAGASDPVTKAVVAGVGPFSGATGRGAAVLGAALTVTAPWSAFCNVIAATRSTGNADAAIVCGAYAVAASVPDEIVVEAVAVGCEVAVRLRRVIGSVDTPWDVDAVVSRFGTVAAVGRLLGLSEPELIMAFGIAGGQAGELAMLRGTANEALQHGRAAFDAVEACLIARDGYNASDHIIEGPGGAVAVLFPTALAASASDGLGSTWEFATSSDESLKTLYSAVADHPAAGELLT